MIRFFRLYSHGGSVCTWVGRDVSAQMVLKVRPNERSQSVLSENTEARRECLICCILGTTDHHGGSVLGSASC